LGLAAFLTAVALAAMTPEQKAAAVVVSGLPAPPAVGGVLVHRSRAGEPRPANALVFVDQEGADVRVFPSLPPHRPASAYRSAPEALAAGVATGRALRRAGVDVDLAPVLDAPDGPLGARHFRSQAIGRAFGRGLRRAGVGACPKHFPGLGSTAISTDERPHVRGTVRRREVAGFAAREWPCVMVGHAFYPSLGSLRASLEPATYRLLRAQGFGGVAITDSLSIVSRPPRYWPRRAIRAGADMLLFSSPAHARRAIRDLIPLARAGELDAAVARVLRLRAALSRT
jgi:beta-N-acetylhexosaminidase